MWGTIPQSSGLTTTVLDLTNDLLPLLVGLIGLTWLSAVIIAGMAIQHYCHRETTLQGKLHLPLRITGMRHNKLTRKEKNNEKATATPPK